LRIIDVLRIAVGNLMRNKLRTFLTVSGVVVGISTIVFLVTLGFGLQNLVIRKTTNLEALKVITLNSKNKEESKNLNSTLVQKLQDIPNVDVVTPSYYFSASIDGYEGLAPAIYAIESGHFEVYDLKTKNGKQFTNETAKEIIVNKKLVDDLKEDQNQIIGKSFKFKITGISQDDSTKTMDVELKVVDVLNDESPGKIGYSPFKVFADTNSNYYNIKVKVKNQELLPEVKKIIESMGFSTSVIKNQLGAINLAFEIINGLLGAFGMVALFVAAIGIFNTMTISLLERTHEIGIMKAIGGRDKDCSRIFTAEAATIGLMGGAFGMTCGWGIGRLLEVIINFLASKAGPADQVPGHLFYTPPIFTIGVVVFAFLVSTFAGIWPARRASKLNPLEALRYE